MTTTSPKDNLHVQGFSKWAPANIGPYSQANKCGEAIFLAGQIGMEPGTMKLHASFTRQYEQILVNFDQVLGVYNTTLKASAVKVIVYISAYCELKTVMKERIRADFCGVPLLIMRVHTLPRDALVEFEVFAHL